MKLNKKGFLFGAIGVVPSVFILISALLVGHSQLPGTKKTFREKKAIRMCEEQGGLQCADMISTWSDGDVLDFIRDDEVPAVINNGGNL